MFLKQDLLERVELNRLVASSSFGPLQATDYCLLYFALIGPWIVLRICNLILFSTVEELDPRRCHFEILAAGLAQRFLHD